MPSGSQAATVSKGTLWTSYFLTGLAVLFLFFDSAGKLMKAAPVVEGTTQLGYSASVILPLGIVLLVCTAAYLIPQTTMLGAILLTGYLGGAIATHVRVGNPLFSHILFPVYFGLFIWGGIYLREERLRALIPVSSGAAQTPSSKGKLWAGRILTALPVLMLLFSGVMKLVKPAMVVEGFVHLGYRESSAIPIGILELACTILYLIPRTSVLGAILVAGYMGGATATHLRIGEPFYTQILLGVMAWAGLYLRDGRLRALLPVRN